ncbi:FAD:protein FMN transferase [Aeromicrobium sp. CF3.5]|uniref:FAD:protein FMN transferase n=1 Tax=Aeromicrobium sp. CF3.5 TaxID=3373078 RepID=UPI003EE442A3
MHAWTFDAIGTTWQIDTRAPLADDVSAAVLRCVETFDQRWSRFRDDSVVAEMARSAGEWDIGDDAALLDLYDELHEVTGGAVNPLVGRTLSDLGYDATYSLTRSAAPAAVPEWSTLQRRGSTITTTEPVVLDVGAAGKGRLVDRVSDLLAGAGHDAATVDAGGDIHHAGPSPIRVGLEHPGDPTRALGVIDLDPDHALCGSAVNRRAWGEGLHHVLDGRTGRPTTAVVATWVLAPHSCMLADGLATAHFFADPDVLLDRWSHHYVRVHADGRVDWSPDLPGEMFT